LTLFIKFLDFTGFFRLLSGSQPLASSLDSMLRYILPLFPFYILLSKAAKNYYLDQIMTIFLGIAQGFLMVLWCNGFKITM
jgi:positive regulator of sigma E activity